MNQHSSLMFCINNAQCHSRVGVTACADYQLITPPFSPIFYSLTNFFLRKRQGLLLAYRSCPLCPLLYVDVTFNKSNT